MVNAQLVVVPKGSEITKIADLKGKVLAVQDDSTGSYILDRNNELRTSLKDYRKYPDFAAVYMDMDAGRIDAMVVDAVLARYYMVKHPDKYVALEENLGDEVVAVAFRKDDKEYSEKINKALDEMKKRRHHEKRFLNNGWVLTSLNINKLRADGMSCRLFTLLIFNADTETHNGLYYFHPAADVAGNDRNFKIVFYYYCFVNTFRYTAGSGEGFVTWQPAQCRWCLCLAAARYAADAAAFIRLLRTSIYSRYRDQDG